MKIARQQIILGAMILAIGGGGFFALDRWVWQGGLPDGLIQANGRIEGDHVTCPVSFLDESKHCSCVKERR